MLRVPGLQEVGRLFTPAARLLRFAKPAAHEDSLRRPAGFREGSNSRGASLHPSRYPGQRPQLGDTSFAVYSPILLVVGGWRTILDDTAAGWPGKSAVPARASLPSPYQAQEELDCKSHVS